MGQQCRHFPLSPLVVLSPREPEALRQLCTLTGSGQPCCVGLSFQASDVGRLTETHAGEGAVFPPARGARSVLVPLSRALWQGLQLDAGWKKQDTNG